MVYGTRYNNRLLISYPQENSNQHDMQVIFQGMREGDPRTIWDIAAGEVLSEIPVDEIVAVDESGRVYLVWHENGEWQSQVIHHIPRIPFHNVVIDDVDPDSQGNEILVTSEDGTLTLLAQETQSHVSHWKKLNN